MSINIKKLKPFFYPAAFMLIAGFAFVYKIVLKGNADFYIRTVRGGSEAVVTAAETTIPAETKLQTTPTSAESSASADLAQTVQVYICGAVKNPGVYNVAAGTILNEAVEKAGGFTEDAAVTSLNLVYEINSNMSFYIPTVKEVENDRSDGTGVIRGKGTFIWGAGEEAQGTKSQAKVNINTADKAALKTLPGIGDATAQAIIDYRSKTPFKKTEDLKKVTGIGDSKFERVRNFITV